MHDAYVFHIPRQGNILNSFRENYFACPHHLLISEHKFGLFINLQGMLLQIPPCLYNSYSTDTCAMKSINNVEQSQNLDGQIINEIAVVYTPRHIYAECKKVTSSQVAYDIIKQFYPTDTISFRENVYVTYLNRANPILDVFHLSIGGLSATVIDVKYVLAIRCFLLSLQICSFSFRSE